MPSRAADSGDFFFPMVCHSVARQPWCSTRRMVRLTNLAVRALTLARSEPGPSSRKPWRQANRAPTCPGSSASPRNCAAAACSVLIARLSSGLPLPGGWRWSSARGESAGPLAPRCRISAACRKACAACRCAGVCGRRIRSHSASRPPWERASSCAVRHAAPASSGSLRVSSASKNTSASADACADGDGDGDGGGPSGASLSSGMVTVSTPVSGAADEADERAAGAGACTVGFGGANAAASSRVSLARLASTRSAAEASWPQVRASASATSIGRAYRWGAPAACAAAGASAARRADRWSTAPVSGLAANRWASNRRYCCVDVGTVMGWRVSGAAGGVACAGAVPRSCCRPCWVRCTRAAVAACERAARACSPAVAGRSVDSVDGAGGA